MSSISLERVTVEFPIYNASSRSMKSELFRHAVGGSIETARNHPKIVAVRNVSLRIADGDRLGVVGGNGAGKSTLLRVLAGVYEPPIGRVCIEGSVASLTDIMMGMDFEATGYDNIILRAVFLGMSVKQAREKIPEITDFTELGEFLKLPIRTYSSGMMLRLAFAVTTAVTPEIIIMDEMIGAGDAAFVLKAQARINHLISGCRILVIASHDAGIIGRFCNKVAYMEEGQIVRMGATEEVLSAYGMRSGREPALRQLGRSGIAGER